MEDPGYPLGGANPLGALTSNAAAFWQKHLKMKELGPVGGGGVRAGGTLWICQCPLIRKALLNETIIVV